MVSLRLQAPNPLDFDGFVNLLGYRTLELDSEETLLSALSRWDKNNSGLISEDKYVLEYNKKIFFNHSCAGSRIYTRRNVFPIVVLKREINML